MTTANDDHEEAIVQSENRIYLIMSMIYIVNFACCVAYSAVAIIFPSHVLNKGLNSFWTGLIIASYPVA